MYTEKEFYMQITWCIIKLYTLQNSNLSDIGFLRKCYIKPQTQCVFQLNRNILQIFSIGRRVPRLLKNVLNLSISKKIIREQIPGDFIML